MRAGEPHGIGAMKSGYDKKRAPRTRLLSREELVLWRHVTADVKPRANKNPPKIHFDAIPTLAVPTEPASTEKAAPAAAKKLTAQKEAGSGYVHALTPMAPLDRRLKRRLSSGKADVDDVIDLHGMTQAQAHHALNSFLWRAVGSGAKIVLVITGKGNFQNADDPQASERGVLRRCAPEWLRASSLRPIVLSIEEAGRPHGGSGALYVRLRRGAR
jgi:DNA-nicking Smr family endonuclease